MTDNKLMSVWNHANKTDPSSTKDNKSGGHKSTSINGYWLVKKATELWGPCGTGWGYEILEDTFTEGVPIFDKETKEVLCMSKMHTIKLRLWYPDSKEGVINYGHTPYVYNSKYGPICDMEAPKKSLTDAVKKCLSFLGFSSDIFMGEWDNPEYLEQRKLEEAVEKADNKDEELERQEGEYRQWFKDHMETIKTAVTLNELETVFKVVFRKLKARNDQESIKQATLAKDKRKKELENK